MDLLKRFIRSILTLRHYLHRATQLPPQLVLNRLLGIVRRKVESCAKRRRDIRCSTFLNPEDVSKGNLFRYWNTFSVKDLIKDAGPLFSVTGYYLDHRFNLLGSGWVRVRHKMPCAGLENLRYEMGIGTDIDSEGRWLRKWINKANLPESQRIWKLIQPITNRGNHSAIDWHLDFKSGYRYPETTWYKSIRYGIKPGVDVKVPWELARMQHLPQLALVYALKDRQPFAYIQEFRNQVLDFIATNPPRFGVNWHSTMDVGIRVVNWLVAYDLFQAFGVAFDEEFKSEFSRSIYQHGHHILENLEWNPVLRGNHYLSNIVSLLFVAAFLPCSDEISTWLAFSIQELIKEVEGQFASEGTNFEASTCYHRLSAEFVVYGTALVLGLPEEKKASLKNYDYRSHKVLAKLKPAPIQLYPLKGGNCFTPFPKWYIERLETMAEFSMHLTKANGHIPQIGDNDSGRFLKLQPTFHRITVTEAKSLYLNLKNYDEVTEDAPYWDEDLLDHRHLVAAMNGLFRRDDFAEFVGPGWLETDFIQHLSKGVRLPSCRHPNDSAAPAESFSGIDDDIQVFPYPCFGLYLYRCQQFYIAIRCGSIGQNGNGGHAHNDQLSFELNLQGHDFIVDGGSYLYTPIPQIRNEFRSTRAHNTLSMEGFEQHHWAEGLNGLFSLKNGTQYRTPVYDQKHFKGEYVGHGLRHIRAFEFDKRDITIEDISWSESTGELNFNLAPEVDIRQINEESPEEYLLCMEKGGVVLKLLLTGFRKIEVTPGFFSNGYGKRMSNQRLKCDRAKSRTTARLMMD